MSPLATTVQLVVETLVFLAMGGMPIEGIARLRFNGVETSFSMTALHDAIAALPAPLFCSSRTEGSTLVVDCLPDASPPRPPEHYRYSPAFALEWLPGFQRSQGEPLPDDRVLVTFVGGASPAQRYATVVDAKAYLKSYSIANMATAVGIHRSDGRAVSLTIRVRPAMNDSLLNVLQKLTP